MGLRDALDKATELAMDTARVVDPEKVADAVSDVAKSAAKAAKSVDLDQVEGVVKDVIDYTADTVNSKLGRDGSSRSSSDTSTASQRAAARKNHISVTTEFKKD